MNSGPSGDDPSLLFACNNMNLNRSRIYNIGCRKKPAELFRKDLISAMKLPDSDQLNREDYLMITDPWREEWEKGVQVPVNPESVPHPKSRVVGSPSKKDPNFKMPKKLLKTEPQRENAPSKYELDLVDLCWLSSINESPELQREKMLPIPERLLERVIDFLEHECASNMSSKKVGIEFDDHVICDVCRSPDGEDGNEMVFCEVCNICVHQACYGITQIPEGDWLCSPCRQYGSPKGVKCVFCPNTGGALKPTSNDDQWAHVSCALWVPEVSIGCVTAMEPITKIKSIPQTRWNLLCSLCGIKEGAPIQCSLATCKTAYHVTCAFKHKLKMKAIVDETSKGVKLKSFCPKHSDKASSHNDSNSSNQHEIEIAADVEGSSTGSLEFWKYIDVNKVQEHFKRQKSENSYNNKNIELAVDFIVNYWKLKRSANFGSSLIKLTTSALEEQQLWERKELLRLRVELERVRNLSYMICRREKVKRNWLRTHQEVVQKTLDTFVSEETGELNYVFNDDSRKLLDGLLNTSVIYDYNESKDKNNVRRLVRVINKMNEADRLYRPKPNPYARPYPTKRGASATASSSSSGSSSQDTVSSKLTQGQSSSESRTQMKQEPIESLACSENDAKLKINSPANRGKSETKTPVRTTPNGFKSISPPNMNGSARFRKKLRLNGLRDSNAAAAAAVRRSLNFRHSPRSLLTPKSEPTNNHILRNHQNSKLSSPLSAKRNLRNYNRISSKRHLFQANGKESNKSADCKSTNSVLEKEKTNIGSSNAPTTERRFLSRLGLGFLMWNRR